MHVEICEKCRRVRLVLMGLLIVFAALAGYHWGAIIQNLDAGVREHDVIIMAAVFSILAVLTGLWIETVVTRTEREVALAQAAEQEKAQEALVNGEQARELDRIVTKLAEDNKDLRYRLMSAKVHEVSEEMIEDMGDATLKFSKAS
ncbi:hypothetical protein [Aestuariivirga sp.]|uniref:hypothetical protein n=1 Tax=Aestuariivirga sp. TaxID=2650926 RepID=UPI0035B4D566